MLLGFVRLTVNVYGVEPVSPSALSASAATSDTLVLSSFWITPLAVGVPNDPHHRAVESVTVKPSSVSAVVSPLTVTVNVLLVWPAAKVNVPLDNAPAAEVHAASPHSSHSPPPRTSPSLSLLLRFVRPTRSL